MIGIEWEVPASLTTTAGTLNFNTMPGLILDPNQCSATKIVRASVDPIPQGDGDILHRRFLTGYTYKLVTQAWADKDTPACAPETRTLGEELGLHLFAMLRSPGRYCWQPTDYGDSRALDQAFWLTGVTQTLSSGGITQYEFEIDSPFPYAIDLTQTSPTIAGFSAITMSGNTAFYPVIKVFGPTSNFVVGNATAGQSITYNGSLPGAQAIGGGDYAEIDTFKGTIFLNGNSSDLSAGIDPTLSSVIFTLIPGFNSVFCTGASSTWLVNNAWE